MNLLLQEIFNDPFSSLLIIGNLVLIESLLSVDNAAVLATMVMELPHEQRNKALKYGIIGAYVFRGICLLTASYLISIWWLKGLGGLYLLYLSVQWWFKNSNRNKVNKEVRKEDTRLYNATVGRMGTFWATIVSVELMDLAFSLDNVFAAVAFSNNILIIFAGVFIGILAMRFIAQGFVKLMEKYPFLEGCAFTVIGILGIKLTMSLYEHFYVGSQLTKALESHEADWLTSLLTISIFFVPVLTSIMFGFPKKKPGSNK
jgi:YkoY family integral membrane protein